MKSVRSAYTYHRGLILGVLLGKAKETVGQLTDKLAQFDQAFNIGVLVQTGSDIARLTADMAQLCKDYIPINCSWVLSNIPARSLQDASCS